MRGWTWGAAAPETRRRRASQRAVGEACRRLSIAPMKETIRRIAVTSGPADSARGRSLTVSKVPIARTRSYACGRAARYLPRDARPPPAVARTADPDRRRRPAPRTQPDARAIRDPGNRSAARGQTADASSASRSRQSSKARSNRNSSAPSPRSPVAAHSAQLHVEQLRHEGACALSRRTRQAGGGRRRPDGTPDRRCADDRQYRRGLRPSAATRGGVAG